MSAYVHQPEAPLQTRSALVIFSGGQDSATCLAWALSRFSSVQTIGFDYGQRHAVVGAALHAVLEHANVFVARLALVPHGAHLAERRVDGLIHKPLARGGAGVFVDGRVRLPVGEKSVEARAANQPQPLGNGQIKAEAVVDAKPFVPHANPSLL